MSVGFNIQEILYISICVELASNYRHMSFYNIFSYIFVLKIIIVHYVISFIVMKS